MTYETGEARLTAAREAQARYYDGASIAADLGRSYGYTRRLLASVGTSFRSRGRQTT